MALFGKKKQDENKEDKKLESAPQSKEMDIILQARQEEEEARQARIAEREAEQEKYKSELQSDIEKAATAAKEVIGMYPAREGEERFFMLVETHVYTEMENADDEIVKGILRGKIRKGQEILVLSGLDSMNIVTVNAIRNDDREVIEEACDEIVELELSKGDFKDPDSPDEQNEARIMTYAVLTNPPAEAGRSEGIRLPAMLCEFSRFPGDQEFFGQLMNAAMTSEFSVPAKIAGGSSSQRRVSFAGMRGENSNGKPMLPAFTSIKAFEKHKDMLAKAGGFNSAIQLDFSQICGVARDENHGGAVIDPLGPVIFALPKEVLDTAVKTVQFHALFGQNKIAESVVPAEGPAQPQQRLREYNVNNPVKIGDYTYIEEAVKRYAGKSADIAKLCMVIITARDDENEKSYVCILDCPQDKFNMHCKEIERLVRPYLKTIKKIQFRPYDKAQFSDEFFSRYPWTYNKLGF